MASNPDVANYESIEMQVMDAFRSSIEWLQPVDSIMEDLDSAITNLEPLANTPASRTFIDILNKCSYASRQWLGSEPQDPDWYIHVAKGTSKGAFVDLTIAIDAGLGQRPVIEIMSDTLPPAYFTHLSEPHARIIEIVPMVSNIQMRPFYEPENDLTDKGDPFTREPYKFDPSTGQGSWVFILDTELAPIDGVREVRKYVIPSDYSVGSLSEMKIDLGFAYGPDDMVDRFPDTRTNDIWTITRGHGTPVACVVGGEVSHITDDWGDVGVSPHANLFLIKVAGSIEQHQNPHPEAYRRAFERVLAAIDLEGIPGSKSVVLFTWEVDLRGEAQADSDAGHDMFDEYLTEFDKRGVTFVMAADNEGRDQGLQVPKAYLGDLAPQSHGTSSNSLITVGGVNPRGSLYVGTTPEGESASNKAPSHPKKGPGSITVYAMAQLVYSCQVSGGKGTVNGTSFAASAIAGLAAYVLALPENQEQFRWSPNDYANNNTVGRRVKDYIHAESFQRVPDSLKTDPAAGNYPYPIPSKIHVGYNMAYGSICQNSSVVVKRDQPSACEVPWTSTPTPTPSSISSLISSVQPFIYLLDKPRPFNGDIKCTDSEADYLLHRRRWMRKRRVHDMQSRF
ncbi:Uu.00g070430.m01.CDS01 [Anthostomella pinea]|uniref:Uu.00g070430.m01.CDS01 n=1 Tax=Anthostomella pinea TaxID=933095 RepID=A0AAI8YNM5_9PEZI|nr:Uu.00g070430.m01.CDS01 [Anthostomella pinea]